MPLTLTLSENVLRHDQLQEAVQRLTESMLRHHALIGNTVMTPNVTANVQIVGEGLSFSGGDTFHGVWVEWKVPSFAFASRAVQRAFGDDATAIIHELSGGRQPRDNIYFNVVHTVDGAWNLDGKAMSNEELGQAIALGSPVHAAS